MDFFCSFIHFFRMSSFPAWSPPTFNPSRHHVAHPLPPPGICTRTLCPSAPCRKWNEGWPPSRDPAGHRALPRQRRRQVPGPLSRQSQALAQYSDNSMAATEMAPAPTTTTSFNAAMETLFRKNWPPQPKFFEL
jgi:hypothetical protein